MTTDPFQHRGTNCYFTVLVPVFTKHYAASWDREFHMSGPTVDHTPFWTQYIFNSLASDVVSSDTFVRL